LYRRETIPHSKKSKWIRIPWFFYCTNCGAISIDSDSYIKPEVIESEIDSIRKAGRGIKILLRKEEQETIQRKRELLRRTT